MQAAAGGPPLVGHIMTLSPHSSPSCPAFLLLLIILFHACQPNYINVRELEGEEAREPDRKNKQAGPQREAPGCRG